MNGQCERPGCVFCEVERTLAFNDRAWIRYIRRPRYEHAWRQAYGPVTIDVSSHASSRREYLEGVVSSWQDEGEGMLLEDLLDESTLKWVRKKAAGK